MRRPLCVCCWVVSELSIDCTYCSGSVLIEDVLSVTVTDFS